jgi:hypothetical protein
MRILFLLVAFQSFSLVTRADDWKPEPGFRSLFNGRDLSGWCFRAKVERNSPKVGDVIERFDGKAQSSDDGR